MIDSNKPLASKLWNFVIRSLNNRECPSIPKVNVKIEKYFYSLLLLFKLWRDLSELKGVYETYTDAFKNSASTLTKAKKYHERFEEIQTFEHVAELIEKRENDNPMNWMQSEADDVMKFDIDFNKYSSITTDAKAMTDLKKGFTGQLKQRNLIPIIHCIIHQEALVGKVIKFSTAMKTITKIINEIKGRHKFLIHRKFKLFLEEYKTVYIDVPLHYPVHWLNVTFLTKLAFITDINNQLRLLNLKLQRMNQNISQLVRHVDSFRRKLQLLKSHLNDNIFHFFPSCQILLEEQDNNCNFKDIHFFGLRFHFMFGSTYLCKTSFSKIVIKDVSDFANKRFRQSK
ncbi:F200A protein, partial [Acromyrmex insinuator]